MSAKLQNLNRTEQKQITRQKLLNATVDIIASEGLEGVTLSKVAELTGLSRGICNYHFETKERLMLEALRILYQEHEEIWRKTIFNIEESPEDRLKNLIKVMLTPPIAEHKKLSVWLAFWGVAPNRKTYLEICSTVDREFENEVEALLLQISDGKDMVNGMSLKAISVALVSMIDGFWVNYLISPGCLTSDDAIKACLAYLCSFFVEFREGLN